MREGQLTAARVERLHAILQRIRSFPPEGIGRDKAAHIIWTVCGGVFEEVPPLLAALVETDLVTSRDGRVRITKAGKRIATQDHQQGGRLLGLALIRSGRFAEQARLLTESSEAGEDGSLRCGRAQAMRLAPQLVGVLRKWPDVTLEAQFVVPHSLASELLDAWSLVPSKTRDESRRLSIGDRAELYSYQLERRRAVDASNIRWVSRDNDNLGYDVEDVSADPSRLIEVKGSGGTSVRFFLSANEWRVAHVDAARFEIHYWGEIDLNLSPQKDFMRLRSLGFPLVFRDIQRVIGLGLLAAKVDSFDIRQA